MPIRVRSAHFVDDQVDEVRGEFCQEIENSGNLELKVHGANHKPVVISLRDNLDACRKWSLNVH